jgi:hypothetical protein
MMRALYLSGMNSALDYELQRHPSPRQTEGRPVYPLVLAGLLLVWVVFSAATAILVVALLLPGHLGLSDLLQTLGNLPPTDSPSFMTRMMIDLSGIE